MVLRNYEKSGPLLIMLIIYNLKMFTYCKRVMSKKKVFNFSNDTCGEKFDRSLNQNRSENGGLKSFCFLVLDTARAWRKRSGKRSAVVNRKYTFCRLRKY